MGNKKQFDKDLYEKCDRAAKEASVKLLQIVTPRLVLLKSLDEQKNEFAVSDFIMHDQQSGTDVRIEAEQKRGGWEARGKWDRWPTLDVPGRKIESKAKYYVMWNWYFDTAAFCLMKTVQASIQKCKPTKTDTGKRIQRTENEPFFKVDLDQISAWFTTYPDGVYKRIDRFGNVIENYGAKNEKRIDITQNELDVFTWG